MTQLGKEEQAFDNNIKSKLENLNPTCKDGSWSAFEKKLEIFDEAEKGNHPFDAIIYEKLTQNTRTYQPKHWNLLLKKLDAKNEPVVYFFNKWKYQIAAAVLLFVVFKQYDQPVFDNYVNQENKVDVIAEKKNNAAHASEAKAETKNTIQNQQTEPTESKMHTSEQAIAIADAITPNEVQNAIISTSNIVDVVQNVGTIQQTTVAKAETVQEDVHGFQQEHFSTSNIAELVNIDSKEKIEIVPTLVKSADENVKSINAISDKKFELLAIKTNPAKLVLSVKGLADLNYVMTPFDADFGQKGFSRYSGGYGTAILLGIQKGIYEVSAGVAYKNLQYQPDQILEIFDGGLLEGGYRSKSLENISLDLLSIPVNVNARVFKKNRLSLFTSIGAAVSVALRTNYDLTLQLLKNDRTNNSQNFLPVEQTNDDSNSLYNKKSYYKGIADGGNFSSTAFMTIKGGIGIEYAINPRLSMTIESEYNQYITKRGLGPKNDRVNSLSLGIGTKVIL